MIRLVVVALTVALLATPVVAAAEQDAEDQAAVAREERLSRAQFFTTVLWGVGAALLVVDARTEHKAVPWTASAVFAGAAASTLWEIRLKRSRHAVVTVNRGLGYRLAW